MSKKILNGFKINNLKKGDHIHGHSHNHCTCGCHDHHKKSVVCGCEEDKQFNNNDNYVENTQCNCHEHEEDSCQRHEECGENPDDEIDHIHFHKHDEECCCSVDDDTESTKNEDRTQEIRDRCQNDIKDGMVKEYLLKGLGCAGCAAKIEERVRKLDEVEIADLAFATSTLKVKPLSDNIEDELFDKINYIVTTLEPDVKVIDKDTIRDYDEVIESNNSNHAHSSQGVDRKKALKMGVGLLLFIVAFICKASFKGQVYSTPLFIASYVVIGTNIILKSIKNISRKEIFDENFLMMIATLAALLIGEYPEAVMVVLLYEIGEYFQGKAVESSRKSISNLMDIRPDYANIKDGNDIKRVSPKQVKVGDIIIVKPGEKVPLDGVIIEGSSSVDTSALTGESVPRDVIEGQDITSGFINITGLLTIRVSKSFKDSAVSKILDLVQNASSKKARTELRITKFARYYTPTVVFLALLTAILPPLFMQDQSFHTWIYRAASFLVISCPCALVISVPMGYFAGLGASSRNGILIKGGNYLEALTNIDKVVFDKTGTLTKGNFKVDLIEAEEWISKEELLKYAAYVESFSNHPIALSIVKEYSCEVDKAHIKDFREIAGKGAEAFVDGKSIYVGNKNIMEDKSIKFRTVPYAGTVVYVAVDSKYAGCIVIKDQIKEDSREAVEKLKGFGISEIVMLTGDRKITAESVGKELNIDKVYSELLPHEKVEKVEEMYNNKDSNKGLVFVGDGINDAPVLARADVGVAMGGVGSDAAIEAADVVIMNDEPSKLAHAIKIARATKKIVNLNIIFALGTKLIILILAVLGIASMWLAVFADVGVALLAVMNSMRILRVK
ncbi:heavy metal translocating P-type ATPase [Clostridium sp. MB40-C1]|uniref:heavy metal translocating P-type ATPase n=1 Tax=Clostridium sp. MB40-C1 TaxID=3070996 RepID=UPI0027E04563|nr:heavy metal translocating P-type ATPase [Clostridium sp. MB40-C1]WMJ80822.1 heavy metal translocating P-type ATPase [Clostridium sp. MB40-C1]